MVNRGPSRGCFKCRARKVKCDEAKPKCTRCLRAGITCSGYQTFHSRVKPIKASSADSGYHDETSTDESYEIEGTPDPDHVESSSLYALTESSESQAISYYFEHFSPRLHGYWTDLLPAVYAKEKSNSLLRVATLSVAYSFISLEPQYDHFKTLAISEYLRTIRIVKSLVNKPKVAYDDSFLMAMLILGIWEHSRSIALESCNRSIHLQGIVAVMKNRPLRSFNSTLSRRLLMSVYAGMVYLSSRTDSTVLPTCSTNTMTENDSIPSSCSLELISSYIDGVSSQYPSINTEMDDFYLLARQITSLGGLLWRTKEILEGPAAENVSREDILKLYHEARGFDLEIRRWPTLRSDRRPHRSIPLEQSPFKSNKAVYPKQIDVYASIARAATCCAWRLAHIKVLEVLMAITPHLKLFAAAGEAEVFQQEQSDCEEMMKHYIDDICAAVPYFLSPKAPEVIAKSYPHPPGQAYMPDCSGIDLVTGMSQMNLVVYHASLCECAPLSQRQWLQRYLTLLSKDPGDIKKATWLEVNSEIDEPAYSARFEVALSGPYRRAN